MAEGGSGVVDGAGLGVAPVVAGAVAGVVRGAGARARTPPPGRIGGEVGATVGSGAPGVVVRGYVHADGGTGAREGADEDAL